MSTDDPLSGLVAVGRVIRPHGLKGAVAIEPLTDRPDERFSAGVQVLRADRGSLTVRRFQRTEKAPLVTFVEIGDRDEAEALRGEILYIEESQRRSLDPEEFWPEDLIGLTVVRRDGSLFGTVVSVELGTGQHRLEIDHEGRRSMIPFVTEIVPEVDLAAGRLVVDPPPGLTD